MNLIEGAVLNVMIPAYNAHEFIEDCLDSIYNQTYFQQGNKFSVYLCVDGCEKTLKKALEIKLKYKNLTILNCKKNKGTYIALNTILSVIKEGNCIVFGADDTMQPNMISEILRVGKVGVVKSDGILVAPVDLIKEFGGFQAWRCAGDTEIIDRMKRAKVELHRYPPLFNRRYHKDQITKSKEYGHGSEIREQYKKIIASKRPLFVKPEINKFEIIRSTPISFNIATFPARKEYLKRVINSVYNQVDIIRVCLNEYEKIPAFLKKKKIVAVIPENDLRDAGKFMWSKDKRNEYYFTGDDDLLYSREYFQRHIEELEKHGGKVAITSHGRILKEKTTDLKDVEKYIPCLKTVKEDNFATIGGTGVMVIDLNEITVDLSEINCAGACDIGAGIVIPKILARAHRKEELEYILPKGAPDLWSENQVDLHAELLKRLWKAKKEVKKEIKPSASLRSYVINLEYEKERLKIFRAEEVNIGLKSEVVVPVKVDDPSVLKALEMWSKPYSNRERKAKEISNKFTFAKILENETAEKTIIFEDDVYIKAGSEKILKEIFKELPADFGICYLGCYFRSDTDLEKYSKNLLKVSGEKPRIWGAHGIIYNKKIYKELAEKLYSNELITDKLISDEIVSKYKCFAVFPMICMQSQKAQKVTLNRMHGDFDFAKLERQNLSYINNCMR